MSRQNYFVCPRCGQVHDSDPQSRGEAFTAMSSSGQETRFSPEQPGFDSPHRYQTAALSPSLAPPASKPWCQICGKETAVYCADCQKALALPEPEAAPPHQEWTAQMHYRIPHTFRSGCGVSSTGGIHWTTDMDHVTCPECAALSLSSQRCDTDTT